MNMSKKGFTLIEMILAIAIFSAVMLTVVLLFIKLNNAQRKNQSRLDLLNETRFSIDLMGQEILSGSAFPSGCGTGCNPNVNSPFVFASKVRPDVPLKRIEYYLDASTGRIMRGEQKTFGVCNAIPFLPAHPECYAPLTAVKINISQLTFTVINKGVRLQPAVTITVGGTIQGESFKLSSSYSPRFLQNPSAVPPSDNVLPFIQITDPPPPTYTTNALTVNLSGIASDNVGVVSVKWKNQKNGANGSASSGNNFLNWSVLNIPLQGSASNLIVVTAADAAGNQASDQITVISTAPLPAPTLSANPYCNSSDGNDYVSLNVSNVGATSYDIERCSGTCSSSGSWSYLRSGGTSQTDGPLGLGETWSYRARAYSSLSNTFSPYSNIAVATTPSSCSIILPPPPPPPPDCTGATLCNGSSASGNNGDVICSAGGTQLTCVAGSGWQPSGSCTCPPPPPPPACTGATLCDGSSASGNIGDVICGSGNTKLTCMSGGWTATGSCTCPPPPPGTFTLSANPLVITACVTGDQTTRANSAPDSKITITDQGYGGPVSFTCSVPANSNCIFNPPSPVISGGHTFFEVNVPGNLAVGNYPITIIGSGGVTTKSIDLVLSVSNTCQGQR